MELNDLKKARPYMEAALDIRRRRDTEEEYCNTLNNLGNLESAEGRLDEALATFGNAEAIRHSIGEDGIVGLALTSLGIARVLNLKGQQMLAEIKVDVARDIVLRKFGAHGIFMPEYRSPTAVEAG